MKKLVKINIMKILRIENDLLYHNAYIFTVYKKYKFFTNYSIVNLLLIFFSKHPFKILEIFSFKSYGKCILFY